MTAKSHVITSLTVGLIPILLIPEYMIYAKEFVLIYIAGVVLGSLFPDIDEENSSIGRKTIFISSMLNKLIGHRTWTHNIFLYIPFFFLGVYINGYYGVFIVGFSIGAVLHILEDSITNSGVNYALRPFLHKFALLPKRLRFKTNGNFENLIFYPSICLLLLIEFYFIQSHITGVVF